jgi:hypothetical protein
MTSIKTARRFELTAKSKTEARPFVDQKVRGSAESRERSCAALNKVGLSLRGEPVRLVLRQHILTREAMVSDRTFERHVPHDMLQPAQCDQIPVNLLDH